MTRRRFVQALASIALLPSLGWLGVKGLEYVEHPPGIIKRRSGTRYICSGDQWLRFTLSEKSNLVESPEIREWLNRVAELVQSEVEKDMNDLMVYGSTRPRI